MQNQNKDELEKEIKILISKLGNYDPTSDEYKATLEALTKLTRVLEPLNKRETDDIRASLEDEKFHQEIEHRKEQTLLDKERLSVEKKRLEDETFNKNRELSIKEKSDKRLFWLTLAGTIVPATIGIVSNIIAIRNYNKLAIRALNMEYIDNSITPRSYNECMNNINKFVSKK